MTVSLNLAGLVSIALSLVLPVLVGLVTKWSTSSPVKAVLLLFFAAVTALLAQYIAAGSDFKWSTAALAALLGFATAVASHFGLLKPSGVTAAAQNTLNKDNTPPPAQ